jgi:hypothetical protein
LPLQERRLPGRKLDRVGAGRDQNRERPLQVLDPGQEGRLAEETVVDGDVEAPPVGGEQTVETRIQSSSLSPASLCVRATHSTTPVELAASAQARGWRVTER